MGIGATESLIASLCAIPALLVPILTLAGVVLIYLKLSRIERLLDEIYRKGER